MQLVITTSLGLESVAKKEIQKLGYEITSVTDKAISFEGDFEAVAKVNVYSRVGNRVYIQLAKQGVYDFDELYDTVSAIDWKQYLPKGAYIVVKAHSKSSQLESTPTIQSVTKKAIVTNLTDGFWQEDQTMPFIIEVFIKDDICQILLDTSGEPLHKRGYRTVTGEAPIKETLAAGILVLSGWRWFKQDLYDPMCGSGTIAIEAAMLAKNMAPGLRRSFVCEQFPCFDTTIMGDVKKVANQQIEKGNIKIHASDMDPEMVEITHTHARRIWVEDIIDVKEGSMLELEYPLEWAMVTNPPYGERLDGDMERIYRHLYNLYMHSPELRGGFVTSYEEAQKMFQSFKNRKLYNGGMKVYFYSKKK